MSSVKIQKIHAREVLDSRGNPTVEAEVTVNGQVYRAIAPSGASTGKHEAVELRDHEKRYLGLGVQKAVENTKTFISERLVGMDIRNQQVIDEALIETDGTKEKSNFGANAMLAVSLACTRAGADARKVPLYRYIAQISGTKGTRLPVPMCNIINGGKHAGQDADIQEHMIMPIKAGSLSEALQHTTEIYHTLKQLLKKKFGSQATLVGDEGGFVPPLKTVSSRLDIIQKAIDQLGYEKEFAFALDAAASEFYNQKREKYRINKRWYTSEKLMDFYEDLSKSYSLFSIEDGFAEDDWKSWQAFTKRSGRKIQIVGDDLLATNTERISTAIKNNACNALLLKVNQIGTLTEAINAAKLAQKNGWNSIVSHRSGETEDTFIADFVVGVSAGQAKFGAPARSERTAKYNQLFRIEEDLGRKAVYGLP